MSSDNPMAGLPAGEAREDERELEKQAEKVENAEPKPTLSVELAVMPVSAPDAHGESVPLRTEDGKEAGIQGQVIIPLSALAAQHEELRKVKPCISCRFGFFPKERSDLWADREAHVAMARRVHIVPPDQTSFEYLGCPMRTDDFPEKPEIMWTHVSQTCSHHTFRKNWLARLKKWMRIRFAGAFR